MEKHNKFLHTLESCWLCMRFPFLYPRNRFTGRHHANVLSSLIWKLYKDSVQEISVTATQEKGDINPREKFYNNTYLSFLDYRVELEKHNKKLFIWSIKENIKHEIDLTKLLLSEDKFEIIGTSLIFAIGGNPIIKVHVKVKDENDTNNYGFHFNKVEIITNRWKHFWHNVISWFDSEILDKILIIPTFTELDAMEPGWRKAFGIQLCKELKAQLKNDKYLYKYRITQIKEKWGYLHWYDYGASKEAHDIIRKYEDISWNTCLVCGKPATKISSGWISPYCDDCYPNEKVVYQKKVNGEWKEINDENIYIKANTKEEQFENMNIIIEDDSILINEMQYSQNAINGTFRHSIDKKLYEKYNKKYLILTNSSSPIAKNGCNKLFWSEHFQIYVAAEW